jgi:uncharacterized protein (TIGR02231 family)
MLQAIVALLFLPPGPFLPTREDPRPLASALAAVTVYPGTASVLRRAELPGPGRFVLTGLPASLDPDSVRVRLAGGEVVSVEVRERLQTNVSDGRLAELRARVRTLEGELASLTDEDGVLHALLEHVQRLLRQEEHAHEESVAAARVDPGAWEANFTYLATKLRELTAAARDLAPRLADKRAELEDQRLALGNCESAGPVAQKDLWLDVVGGGGALEVEYLVSGASWEPYYDLRAKKDLSGVELAYRARVQQSTGEDWREAEILLSTAQPQRGAQGPDPRPVWLALFDPTLDRRKSALASEAVRDLGYGGDEIPALRADAPSAFAAVEHEGLSVRFRLPRKETIESRPEPTSVLVGRAELALTSEHRCVPALDPTVWLRGKAKNTTEWVLLPGRAAVYFGADFVGHSELAAVQPGQELELALGADLGLVVKRTQLADQRESGGVFRSTVTQHAAWRIELENHGAFTHAADGSVEVIVQEVLPRVRDERIEVELERVTPKLAEDARWKKEREETGALTWVVRAPKAGTTTIELTTEVSFPDGLRLVPQ